MSIKRSSRRRVVAASVAGLVLLLGVGSYTVASAANRGHEHRGGHGPGHSTPTRTTTTSPTTTSTASATTQPTKTATTSTTKPATTSTTKPATTSATQPATVTSTTAAAGVTLPPANGQFDYQIGGPYTPAAAVRIVDRDHAEKPVSGKYNICYINAFQSQDGEAATWSGLILKDSSGANFEDPDWEGEYFLDTSTAAKRQSIAAIEGKWIEACAAAGYQAVEPDNLDTYDRSDGLLTKANNVALAKLLADRAHAAGLAIAQKNTAGLTKSDAKTAGFDFAIAEECSVYTECDVYTDIYGTQVYEIEYTDNQASAYTKACAAQGKDISVILRDRDVVPAGNKAYHYEAC